MEITARFSHDKLDHSIVNKTHLVVSVTAPTLDWVKKRPALCVIGLIDLSGSMAGDKLDYAKKSLLKLVDQLQPGDFAGLIAFESRSHVLVKPRPVDAAFKNEMRKAIDNLRVMGGTNLWSGLEASVKAMQALDLPPKFLKRVIMFTDGQPTEGVTDQSQILKLTGSNRGSITISSFGYGGGAYGCDQDFLTKLAAEGQGNYAYVQNPDDALTAFGRELGGLLSTYAQDIRLSLEPHNGHRITQVVTDIQVETDPLGETDFSFPDILSEETRHFVFEVELAQQEKGGPRAVNLFSVTCSYAILNEEGKRETRTVEAKAKAQFVDSEDAQKGPHKDLDSIIALAQVVRAQLTAEEEAKKGQFEAAARIMANVSHNVSQRGHVGTSRMAEALQQRVGSADLYATSAGYLRSMSYGGTRSMGLSGMDREAGELLASTGVSFSNSSMEHYTQAFTAEGVNPPAFVAPPESAEKAWQQIQEAVQNNPAIHNFQVSLGSPTITNPTLGASLSSLGSGAVFPATLLTDSSRVDPVPLPDDPGLSSLVSDKSE